MRIYSNLLEAYKETERDLWEMGIDVHPNTMQDKVIAGNDDYATKELQGYGFQFTNARHNDVVGEDVAIAHIMGDQAMACRAYIEQEFFDRISERSLNPGKSYLHRPEVWGEFLHKGRFAYTYSERFTPQLRRILKELQRNPDTRQAILTIHSNINTYQSGVAATESQDLDGMGGGHRIPCSMYYQFLVRKNAVSMIYTMRSCDFLTHFAIDIVLAIKMMRHMAEQLELRPGTLTYFAGSLHAYRKDMKKRGVF